MWQFSPFLDDCSGAVNNFAQSAYSEITGGIFHRESYPLASFTGSYHLTLSQYALSLSGQSKRTASCGAPG